ncbi:MAG: molybdenum cofactor biosynthesis protein MoaE [Flavobacteriales bacterium CG_4_9_14_0_2_um_filter_35_242]|nr:molybdenum cofactor biosynthesis protein MoaE [Zetaproteobacteria bacterium]NDK18306.1 molybdenum cofactor biosynthesis protein MoaE [Flavobacteriales bacterium]OIO12876.1 MAG: molybdenum cofactor biosynthesis protein MoaE [Flavobacteriaceae bacterium CG1_02_35_72]PIV17275.1 MAG: molybdenum cofactor biosynthesis protein MoaE [Flavobacteriales bacterium CG03_land_8_20_14_0_80_35_15]PIX06999.1 MAG: molybdenum cofactor biosynthesis protein MoaE [Flavobacteriales bacterium CG_4_8_14_3_um_filter_
MKNKISVLVTSEKLNIQTCYDFVKDDSCGGITLFVGTVRNESYQKKVTLLNFSTYKAMAVKELNNIAVQALADFTILKIAIHHAEGDLKIGDIPVIIAVSAPHRDAAFKACQFAIDTLKKSVPIWKKEHFNDGAIWVNAHP